MNERQFLKKLAQSKAREALVSAIYDEMVDYCYDNNITEEEMSSERIEQLAEGVVERGLSFENNYNESKWEWHGERK